MSSQVKISAEFFAKAKADYADWRWSLIREFAQNSIDAPGAASISFTLARDGADTILTVANDGAPMDRATLEGKLLTLGGSGKNFAGDACGGFGIAKSLLYYTHQSYTIHTGDLLVTGAGADYTITDAPGGQGTTSTVRLAGDQVSALEEQVRRFAALAQWRGMLTLNGQPLPTDLRKGARRKDLGWGVCYTNQSFRNLCVVRLNGQPMFTLYTRFKGCVLIELTGKARDVLTSNRDGLARTYASDLSEFLTAVAVDKRSALREQRAEYRRYRGEKQRAEARRPKQADEGVAAVVDLATLAAQVTRLEGQLGLAPGSAPAPTPGGGIRLVCVGREDEPDRTITLGPEFILKNASGRKVPARYTPGDKFSPAARGLVRAWTALLLKLHQLDGRAGEFSVGFVFDDESVAESERTGAYGQVYYVNPVKDGKPRFTGAWAARHELIALAAHEYVHGGRGLGEHDEDYAGALTDVLALCQEHAWDLAELCWDGSDPRAAETDADREEKYLAAVFMLEAQERRIAELEAQLAARG